MLVEWLKIQVRSFSIQSCPIPCTLFRDRRNQDGYVNFTAHKPLPRHFFFFKPAFPSDALSIGEKLWTSAFKRWYRLPIKVWAFTSCGYIPQGKGRAQITLCFGTLEKCRPIIRLWNQTAAWGKSSSCQGNQKHWDNSTHRLWPIPSSQWGPFSVLWEHLALSKGWSQRLQQQLKLILNHEGTPNNCTLSRPYCSISGRMPEQPELSAILLTRLTG